MKRLHPLYATAALAVAASAHAFNPLGFVSETYKDWKERLFGSGHVKDVEAPASGPIAMQPGHPQRFVVDAGAPQRDFAKGTSRFRLIELPEELAHAAVRIQVVAQSNRNGHGNTVYKPLLYVLEDGDGDVPRDPVEAKPLHLDIRPFRRTRLLGCATLEKVRRFAVATSPDFVGKSYDGEVREAVNAPTPGGFYYTTDAVKVKLPYADSGQLIIEVSAEAAAGKGC